ncbi:aminoacyl-tRNA hydrolase [candidate division WOR-1 bacterium RIFCSPHIGHO2_01_FULL_53_15]|uniref:Peptidyl-tRNA hydrolase n=1 Tax=candidate division WOR-1 bacterium RIFCSPHIGHO2_01_FULL_53_15 TaxID=1802564 RepID=A0A1F4Q279_UNCSA|nr:MAG: aminoacyl-tRNA hydrolase [candidate division WOR-1 bacterium RIFCSPHIGHO2_01_FULL_53_15]OGC13619.1 MAG: aminoacyl-tRNA hydrolase [candidate division WOR-1 bacterium RIFCSPHIGHO2_02_FULL_53_26]
MYLIAGLGNPGPEYENTRHNLGFRVVNELASRLGLTSFKEKHHSLLAEGKIGGHKVILAQPQAFMNNSGPAVRGLLAWYKIETAKLIIVYDDVDLEVGMVRAREKGGAGGHHGVESIIESIGSSEFARVRVGVGRENLTGDVSDYVLQNIPPAQREALEAAVVAAAEAVETLINARR